MDQKNDILTQSSLLLELFAEVSGRPYDRQAAKRLLSDASSVEIDDWYRNVTSCGEAIEVRIRAVELTLKQALELAGNSIPVAVLMTDEKNPSPVWKVIFESLRGRFHVRNLADSADQWLTQKQIQKLLSLDQNSNARWLISQQALIPSASDHHGSHSADDDHSSDHHHGVSPWRRLIGFLKPDIGDLSAVLIFSIVIGILTLTTPIAVEALVNTVAFGRFVQPIVILSLIVLVFLVFSSLLTALSIYTVEILQRRFFIRVTEDLAWRIPRLEQTSIDDQHLPELMNRFFDIITIQKSIAKLMLDGLGILLQMLIGMIVLAFYHPFLLGFDIVLMLLIAFMLFVLGRGAGKTAIGESIAKYKVAAWLQELGSHPDAFKLNQGTELAIDRADHVAIEWLNARKRHFRVVFRQVVFSLGIYCLATTVLLGLGGWLVVSRELTLGQLVAAELIVLLIVRSFTKLDGYLESFYDLIAGMDKIGVLLDLPIEKHNRFAVIDSNNAPTISLQDVTIEKNDTIVCKEFNLEIPASKVTAIYAPMGRGKSVVCQILTGIRQPAKGLVKWNQVDLREIRLESLREKVGYASEPQIFVGTIEENIRLGRPILTSTAIRDLLVTVGLEEQISNLKSGINTNLRTNGSPLTQGQCRLLMLVRAIAGMPCLLVLDGTFDHLEVADAERILKGIERICKATIVMTTSRKDIGGLANNVVRLDS